MRRSVLNSTHPPLSVLNTIHQHSPCWALSKLSGTSFFLCPSQIKHYLNCFLFCFSSWKHYCDQLSIVFKNQWRASFWKVESDARPRNSRTWISNQEVKRALLPYLAGTFCETRIASSKRETGAAKAIINAIKYAYFYLAWYSMFRDH